MDGSCEGSSIKMSEGEMASYGHSKSPLYFEDKGKLFAPSGHSICVFFSNFSAVCNINGRKFVLHLKNRVFFNCVNYLPFTCFFNM